MYKRQILDCSGVALAENKVGYNVVFYYSFFPKADQNRIIAGLIEMLEKNGEDWYDPLPLTLAADPVFEEGRDKDIETLRNKLGVNVYATASDCMYNLRELFGIDESCDDLTARKIAGVRYGMVLSDFSINNNQYAFAEDVSTDTALLIKEMSHLLPGVDIVDEDIREMCIRDRYRVHFRTDLAVFPSAMTFLSQGLDSGLPASASPACFPRKSVSTKTFLISSISLTGRITAVRVIPDCSRTTSFTVPIMRSWG